MTGRIGETAIRITKVHENQNQDRVNHLSMGNPASHNRSQRSHSNMGVGELE